MYLIRRLRYMIASKTLHVSMKLISLSVFAIVIVLIMSGVFSQRKAFMTGYYLMKDYGYSLSQAITEVINGDNDTFILTDEGLYFRSDNAPGEEVDITDEDITVEEPDDSVIDDIINGDSENEEISEEGEGNENITEGTSN